MNDSVSTSVEAPEWARLLVSEKAALAAGGLGDLATAWSSTAAAVHADRTALSSGIDGFLFGPNGALTKDGGALSIQVSQSGNTSRVRVNENSSELSDLTDASASAAADLEAGAQRIFDLGLTCQDRCFGARAAFPYNTDAIGYMERLIRIGARVSEEGFGGHFLTALSMLWPATVRALAPFGRADMSCVGGCVQQRIAINFEALTQRYDSLAELLGRFSRCNILVMTDDRRGVLGHVQYRSDTLQITIGVKEGEWVYLNPANLECLSDHVGADAIVPSLTEGSGRFCVHVKDIKVGIKELGCMALPVPSIWLSVEHFPSDHASAQHSAQLGHEWRFTIDYVCSPGKIIESIIRPFLNLTDFRSALKLATKVTISGFSSSSSRFGIDVKFPIPTISSALWSFVRWWTLRHFGQLDELLCVQHIADGIRADLAEDRLIEDSTLDWSIHIRPTMERFFSASSDWFYSYIEEVERAQGGWCRRRRRCLTSWFRICPIRCQPAFHSFADSLL
eukprot:TRINITY_DN37372_c0_g1_i1.p1 TRINITY_DN37372_c0_g1~~TRINITY_DN37372_c0_g1_i1.p1  ORF type:complete len:508 (+),score=35.86 TRINITY_DN37372_c0_g1_i1:71-1594(+)